MKGFFVARTWALLGCLCAAIFSDFLIESNTFGADTAPPSPEKPWSPPGLNKYQEELTKKDFYARQDAEAWKMLTFLVCVVALAAAIASVSNTPFSL